MSDSRDSSASEPDSRRWSRIAERGSMWGMRFTVWCYRTFGPRPAALLVHAIVAYFFLTDTAGRRASRAYLQRVATTPAGRRALERKPGAWASFLRYRCFGLSILDRLAIWAGESGDFEFSVEGDEHCDRLARAKRGGIVLGAHLGNFDALRLLAERQQRVVHVLMFTAHAQRINTIFRELSPDVDLRVIEVDPSSARTALEIRERVERGELVSILADRVEPSDRGRTSCVPFLGGTIELPRAPFLLASILACPVLLMLAFRTGRGHYAMFTENLTDGVRRPRREREKGATELLTTYAGRLEHYCTKYPYQWFNFYDYWGDEVSR
jgi:predicted LPLAT superfamily acyltransferase